MTELSPSKEEYIKFLLTQGYTCILPLDDTETHYAAIMTNLMHSTAIVVGMWYDRFGYYDRWCYTTPQSATAALLLWVSSDPRPSEPTGWFRHQRTGRRRTDGDPEREYINF